jgi:hypothetical protein
LIFKEQILSGNLLNSELKIIVNSLNWFNFLSYARKTIIEDRRSYRRKVRPLSTQRLRMMWSPNLEKPLFIIGSPRSGTTFLGSCISELPEVSYHFEPVATKAAARYVHEGQWDAIKAQKFYSTVYAWLMRIHLDADLRFAEKTPRNCFLISFLYQAFPDAQFIHIIRDGRDAALSHSKKPWLQAASAQSGKRESSGYLHGPYARFWVEPERRQEFEATSDIHRCIWAWRRHTETILAQATNLPVEHYYELRYEDLVTRPHEEADLLLNYLKIDRSESRESLHHAFARANPNSVGGWQREFSEQHLNQTEQEAGPLLRQLGYL